jgi:hypothetical protein
MVAASATPLSTELRQACERRLQKLTLDSKPLTLSGSHEERRAFYRAADRLGIKISIRVMPDGVRLWRIK